MNNSIHQILEIIFALWCIWGRREESVSHPLFDLIQCLNSRCSLGILYLPFSISKSWLLGRYLETICLLIVWLISNFPILWFCLGPNSLSLVRCHVHGPLAKRLMHMVHLSVNTSGVSKSSSDWLNYTGFPGDVCVAFFNVLPGNKEAVTPNPLKKEESRRVYKCDGERLSESTKCWIFKSMWNI